VAQAVVPALQIQTPEFKSHHKEKHIRMGAGQKQGIFQKTKFNLKAGTHSVVDYMQSLG
jgi:hypothetical protein